jgi:hypothetical protein
MAIDTRPVGAATLQIMRKLREDIHLAASVVGLLIALTALLAWVASWPSTVVPTVLLVAAIVADVLGRAIETAVSLQTVPAWFRVPAVVSRAVVGTFVVAGMLAYPTLAKVIGGVVLFVVFTVSVALLVPVLRERYRRPAGETRG